MGRASIFPTGTTIYNSRLAQNGFTVLDTAEGTLVIDMDGNEVQLWQGLTGHPARVLPGGYGVGSLEVSRRYHKDEEQQDLVVVDWDGNVVRRLEGIRQHNDYLFAGQSVGYYAGAESAETVDPRSGNVLVLEHRNLQDQTISGKELLDDVITERNAAGEVVWTWNAAEHIDELGFDAYQRVVIRRHPNLSGEVGNWLHINSIAVLGPNDWYAQGDTRFAPENIMISAGAANLVAIISKASGEIVWRLGPNYAGVSELSAIGQLINPHGAHMIPQGLPGAGDILLYDDGGAMGYGAPHAAAPDGTGVAMREFSRVLQIDPVRLHVTIQYTFAEAGYFGVDGSRIYSPYSSYAQRLENGNTLITESASGRVYEINLDNEIVWEYVNPRFTYKDGIHRTNRVYRAYRIPYAWIPQVTDYEEKDIAALDTEDYHLEGAGAALPEGSVAVTEGADPDRKMLTGVPIDTSKNDQVLHFCLYSHELDKADKQIN